MNVEGIITNERIARIVKKGSAKVTKFYVTMAENYNVKQPDGTFKQEVAYTEYVKYTPAGKEGIWNTLVKGDAINFKYRGKQGTPYTKDGQKVYPGTELVIGMTEYAEPKSVRDARHGAGTSADATASAPEIPPSKADTEVVDDFDWGDLDAAE